MKKSTIKLFILLSIILFLAPDLSFSQKLDQTQLEKKRLQLQKEISKINKLLFHNKEKERDLLGHLDHLHKKIAVRSNFIKLISTEIHFLKTQIEQKEDDIKKLLNDLQLLKEDYAEMIFKSYKSKSKQNRLMFLFSSEDFFQAYSRFRYMQQYLNFRKKQGNCIFEKTEKIEFLIRELEQEKIEKDNLIDKNQKENEKIKDEREIKKNLMKKIKSKEKEYVQKIKKKQSDERKINDEIERIIRRAISESGRKKTNEKVEKFILNPEAANLASHFEKNKGKLHWPVVEGVIIRNFGLTSHPTLKGIKLDSKGIHIATKKDARARAIFKGNVLAIQSVNGRNAVYLQHGNYISLYNNLDEVYVTKGQEVNFNQSLGTVFRDKVTDQTILKFQIWKDTERKNPIDWLEKN